MGKKITNLSLLIILILFVSNSQAQVYYSKILDNAENYNHIDPIKDSTNQMIGFVYTDKVESNFKIEYIYYDSTIILNVDGYPKKTINYNKFDTLFIYGLVEPMPDPRDSLPPYIIHYKIFNNQIVKDSIQTTLYRSLYGLIHRWITKVDISFHLSNGEINGIIFNCNQTESDYVQTLGFTYKDVPTSTYFSLDLQATSISGAVDHLSPGYFNNLDTLGYVILDDYYLDLDFDGFEQTVTRTYFWLKPNLNDETIYIHENDDDTLTINSLFADNFQSETDFDEVIYHGNLYDLSADSQMQVGCFEVLDSTCNLLWYTPVDNITLDFIYHPFHAIAGRDFNNAMILLDYRNGQIELSHSFQRELDKFQYFETGTDQPFLNALGVHGDTLFVYRFDTPTDIVEYGLENNEIPKTFEIKQNFPNPFNATTSITFANHEYQHIELSIYNILGQEIKTLVSANLSPGDHIYNWDGLDEDGHELPSGIYFARLATVDNSELIKMVMLK